MRGARGLRGVLLAVTTCAALLSVTGCGAGAGGTVPEPSGGRGGGASAEVHSGGSPGREAEAEGTYGEPDTSAAPKLPEAELTPATGTFTRKQKEYLEGRVPEGIDPAAVLAGGEEICGRVARTEEVDRKAVIGAIRSKEIAGAKAAITHLCPEHRDLLTAAGN